MADFTVFKQLIDACFPYQLKILLNILNAETNDILEPGLTALKKDEFYRAQIEKGLKWVEPLKEEKGWQGHIYDIEALLKERS